MGSTMFERYDLIVRGGEVWSATGPAHVDLGVRDGKVAAVGDLSADDGDEVIDATGLWVMPGAIDTQVHFREPGLEHKEDLESGTRAAIAGGVTTVFEMPNTVPPTTSREALQHKLDLAAGRAWCDYSFFVGGSPDNVGQLKQLEEAPGSPGIKVFMGSSTGSLLIDDEEVLRAVMLNGRHRMAVHSEDEAVLRENKAAFGETHDVRDHPKIRSVEAAVTSTKRLIRLCRETGRPVHVLHVSTAEELPLIAEAKAEGLPVTCEVTPHHLTLGAEDYETKGPLVQMNPPVRDERHRPALWEAVKSGLVDVLGSDHAPHTLEEKAKPYPASPSGMPGVQTLLPVMMDWALRGQTSVGQIVRLLCEGPASIYGISSKGTLTAGYDADLVLFDPQGSTVVDSSWLQSKCGWSPYEGRTLQGKVVKTVLRGRTVWELGTIGTPSGKPVGFVWKGHDRSAR